MRLYVFFCVREDQTSTDVTGNMRSSHLERLDAALRGSRGMGQRSIEIALSGASGPEEAERVVRNGLPDLLAAEKDQAGINKKLKVESGK